MSTEQNKAAVRRLLEVGIDGWSSMVDELYAPDFVIDGVPQGREAAKQMNTWIRSTYPDLKMHPDIKFMVAEGDYVVVRSTERFTNAGKESSGSDFSAFRFENGKIVETWSGTSAMALMQEVGVTLPSA